MKSLGTTLKEAREKNDLTLRQVDDKTGISSAYLSQIENDKVKNPSASVLYKLASLYGIQLNSLLKSAGIIQTSNKVTKEGSKEEVWANRLAFYAKDLSEEEQEEIIDYIKFKLNKKKHG